MKQLTPAEFAAAFPGVTMGASVGEAMARIEVDATRAEWSEKEFMGAVVKLAKWLGWHPWHVTNARKSAAGWPDLVLLRHRILVAELKVGRNKTTPEQDQYLDWFRAAGVPAFCWTPEDWESIERELTDRKAGAGK